MSIEPVGIHALPLDCTLSSHCGFGRVPALRKICSFFVQAASISRDCWHQTHDDSAGLHVRTCKKTQIDVLTRDTRKEHHVPTPTDRSQSPYSRAAVRHPPLCTRSFTGAIIDSLVREMAGYLTAYLGAWKYCLWLSVTDFVIGVVEMRHNGEISMQSCALTRFEFLNCLTTCIKEKARRTRLLHACQPEISSEFADDSCC